MGLPVEDSLYNQLINTQSPISTAAHLIQLQSQYTQLQLTIQIQNLQLRILNIRLEILERNIEINTLKLRVYQRSN